MAPFPLTVFDDHHRQNQNQQKSRQRQHQRQQHQNQHKRNHQQHMHQTMELKTFNDFKKQLAAESKAAAPGTRKLDKNCNDNINKRTIPYGFNSFPCDDLNSAGDRISSNGNGKKRMKIPGRSHPLSLPLNGVGYNENNVNDNTTGGSNNSIHRNISKHNPNIDNANQTSNSIPFAASNWWKKGNDHMRELMATSLVSLNNDDDVAATFATFVAGANKKYETISTSSEKDANNCPPVTASTTSTSSSAVAESSSGPFPTPELAAVSASKQRYLQLLGEVATSGGNNHRYMNIHHQPQHIYPESMHTHINRAAKNNPQAYHSKHIFASQSSTRYPSIFDKQPSTKTSASTQSFLPLGQSLDVDPSIFPINQMGTRTTMPSQFRQQHHHQQSLYQLPSDHASTSFHSTQSAYFQQYLHRAQREKVRQPGVIRAETVSVDEIRSSGDITEVSHSPAVERELEESFREDTTFDEEVGKSGTNTNNLENKTNGTHIRRKDSIAASVDDDHLIFSDIKVDGIDSDCVNVEGVEVDAAVLVSSGNHLDGKRSSNRSHTTLNSPLIPNLDLELNFSGKVKFRAYQAENWTEKFDELLKFREETGHCLVPNSYPQNPALAQWTKRQRYQYKLKQEGKRSTITDERVRALEEAGFIWDSHKAVWSERLEELKVFQREFNHCNVPSRYQRNHQLAIWVKRQRRQWKNKMDQLPHCMTDERQQALEAVGFVWDMKKKKIIR